MNINPMSNNPHAKLAARKENENGARESATSNPARLAMNHLTVFLSARCRNGCFMLKIRFDVEHYPFVSTPSKFNNTFATEVHAAASAALKSAGSGPSGSVASFFASASSSR